MPSLFFGLTIMTKDTSEADKITSEFEEKLLKDYEVRRRLIEPHWKLKDACIGITEIYFEENARKIFDLFVKRIGPPSEWEISGPNFQFEGWWLRTENSTFEFEKIHRIHMGKQ